MATCPAGHDSAEDDFCDVCGVLIGAAPSLVSQPPSGDDRNTGISGTGISGTGISGTGISGTGISGTGAQRGGVRDGQAGGEPCPRCGTPRGGQFCEGCGYDFKAAPDPAVPSPAPTGNAAPAWGSAPVTAGPPAGPPPPAATRWTAVVTADRAYFESVQADGAPDASVIGFPAYCPQRKFQLSGAEVRIGRRSARSGIEPEIDLTGPPTDPGVSRLHAVLLRGQDGAWAVLDPGSANGTLVNGREIPRDEAVPVRAGDRIHLGAWTVISILRED